MRGIWGSVLAVVLSINVFNVSAAEESGVRQRPSAEQRAQRQEQAKERMRKLDTNHDQQISREEAQQGAPTLAEHFDKIDKNGDGQITREEMREARRARQAQQAARREQRKAEPGSGS